MSAPVLVRTSPVGDEARLCCERCGEHVRDYVLDERADNMVCVSCYWAQESEREAGAQS